MRLMVGLQYLKYLFDESDESVVEKWVENPYWQFFCGRTYFEHELPCHPTSLVRWRHRLGATGVEKLLTETLSTAKREQALRDSELKRVHVDTTVQEKAVAFPTDARLYHKGKAHQPYEFGCKVAVVTTSRSNWVVGVGAVHENPYDGATLSPARAQVERLTAVRPEAAFVDRGFKGAAHHPAGVAVYVSGRKRLRRALQALLRRRAAIEPVIGHLKQEHGMQRNHLLGQEGDRSNALLTGCGFNLRKLWRFFRAAVRLQPA